MIDVSATVGRELRRQAGLRRVSPAAEAHSWQVEGAGGVWLTDPTARDQTLNAKRANGGMFAEPFDAASPNDIERVVADVLRTLLADK